ncbi:bb318115-c458-4b4c-aa70-a66c17a99a95 [Thermothielavioides terrestris]|uniref:Pentacotripeptide-repeat region of PRORP domain-containing protein n=2 Tax=Thermothielavioides terrestris TaxID=2587410 RepID=G2R3H3_THETT|nr:uncharacterized protein THITE_2115186 [Thermothielavioides terrestris NRRL 8126]AEO66783.1 hypothetical protein THITE_2115186 [Thermothielavioides terrestris NRRL 8126]SPQ19993.1 bb318115-c458-4b4c-aa70-a66c17a99a95 [Thermothielavioides terrestris]
MLERTATSIEPCSSSLQRVFPSSRYLLFSSRRKLHTAFWLHGAADFELLDACQALLRLPPTEPRARQKPPKPGAKPETMTASTFLLDFLYPSGTAALLRRPYPLHLVRLESATRPPRTHMSRLFTSAAPRRSEESSSPQAAAEEPASLEEAEEDAAGEQGAPGYGAATDGLEGGEEDATNNAAETETQSTDEVGSDGPANLRKLLSSDHAGAYDQIFQLYTSLDSSLRDEFTTEVLLAISASTRPIEAWRVNELFTRYPVDAWTEDLVRAAVKAQLLLHNVPEAMAIFKTAVEQRGLGQALDYLAAYGFEVSSWDIVLEACEIYFRSKGNEESVPDSAKMHDPRGAAQGAEPPQALDAGAIATPSSPVQGTQHLTEPMWVEPVSGPAPMREAGSAVEPSNPQETETVPEPTTVPEAVPAPESPPSLDAEPAAEQHQHSEAATVPPAAGDPSSVLQSGVAQEAEIDEVSTTMQATEIVPEPAATRTSEAGAELTTVQDPETDSEAVQDIGLKTESMAARDVADSAGGPLSEQITESPPTGGSATEQLTEPGFGYPALAAMGNFEEKAKELYKFLENDPETLSQRTALVDSFLRHIVWHSMELFQPSDVVFMLDRAQDPRCYERYIILIAGQQRKRLASDLYRKYRSLPGVVVSDSVLRVMIDIYFPHNVQGMQQLKRDWYTTYGHPDDRAYHKLMAFHAGHGDVKTLMRLAEEYAVHYDSGVKDDPKFVTTLLNAHAVRGDPEAARKVLEEAVERSGTPPETKQWNILLNAYTKAGDYAGAIDLFTHICSEHDPDDYTFATMMGMAAFRGDLDFTLELLQLANDRNIQASMAMVRALVEAYCQNDRFGEAESLCLRLTKSREIVGDYTYLWNVLLRHSAKRRDLTTLNRLLGLMSTHNVTYNQDTYSHLILGLLYCRQSHHAMHLLRVARREGVFEPTADHYVLLMAAFINSNEPHMALTTHQLMIKWNYHHSAMRMAKVIDALGRWQQLPPSRRRGLDGALFLKLILRDFYKAMEREDRGSPGDIRSVISLYSKVLFVLTQMREFATVEQIIQLHNSRYPSRGTPETIPLKLLHNIMLADFYEKKFDRVKETWDLILRRSTDRYQPAAAILSSQGDPDAPRRPVVYARRFRLCDPLKTMQRLYLEQQDADGLLELVRTVRARGFDLDSKNWNYHVQALARLKRRREAFGVCEKVLMPQWTGWQLVREREGERVRLPLELRRLGSNPYRPRPITHTLLVLAKEYMELERMMLWSQAASREFQSIVDSCPKTVRAITTMMRSGSRLEAQFFGEEERPHIGPVQQYQASAEWRHPGERQRDDPEVSAPASDAWTDDGFLNVGESPAAKKGQAELSAEDVVRALKGDQ